MVGVATRAGREQELWSSPTRALGLGDQRGELSDGMADDEAAATRVYGERRGEGLGTKMPWSQVTRDGLRGVGLLSTTTMR